MELSAPLSTMCTVLGAPRSTIYARRGRGDNVIAFRRPGPAGTIDDEQLLVVIRQVLADSPFTGEGYRKVHARLRREHDLRVGRKRVLRLMRKHHLLAL
jgi:putative transposase